MITKQDLKRLMPLMRTSDSKDEPVVKKMDNPVKFKKRGIIIELSGKTCTGKTKFSNEILIPLFKMIGKDVYYFGDNNHRKETMKIINKIRHDYDFVIIETTED